MRILFIYLSLLTLTFGCARHAPQHETICYHPPLAAPSPQQPVASPSQNKHRITAKPIVMIDPGHGGKDVGAVTPTKPEYQEKNLNLASARMVETFLRQKGFRTVMTRSDDTFVSLDDRVEATKKAAAKLFVSIHFNSAPSKSAKGIEVFYYESDKDKERSKQSKALAQVALNKIIAATGAESRGVKHGNFAVIRNNSVPAILIEGGFMTNEQEMNRIKDPVYMKKFSFAIAEAIETYTK